MSRYFANHILSSQTGADVPVGDDLTAAKAEATRIFGDSFQDGTIEIYDSATVGYACVAWRKAKNVNWVNADLHKGA